MVREKIKKFVRGKVCHRALEMLPVLGEGFEITG